VETVDSEKLSMTVKLRNNLGILQNVTITQPFAGTSSFIMGMPELGSQVIIGFQDNNIYPIAYLPNYTHGLENRNIKKWPDSVKTLEDNESFFRLKKLLPGELALGSSGGIEMFLGEKFVLDDRSGNKFMLRSDDNSITSTACNNSLFSSGVWLNSGIIKRNSIDASNLTDTPNVFRENLSRGAYNYVLRPGGSDPNTDPYYTEYLLEVEDKGYAQQPENDINGDSNGTIRKPTAVFSMGNLVGNNPVLSTYGKLLHPVLFNDVSDDIGDFSLQPLSSGDIDNFGVAVSWYKPDRTNPESGAFFGIDKEGHFYQYIPSATGGGLGKGRSMSILAKGSKKEIWGNDTRYASSWDLKTTGGLSWTIGAHNEKTGNPYSNRSMDIRTKSSVFFMYGVDLLPSIKDFDKSSEDVADPRNYFKVEKISGKERHEVGSARETIIQSSDKLRIEGARTEQIIGASTTHVGSNMNVVVGDAFTEKVSKEKQETYGNRKTMITAGSSELTIKTIQGDIKEEIIGQGSKTVKIKLGNIKDDIIAGNRSVTIRAGNFDVSTTAGNLSMKTNAGQLSFQTRVGKAEIKASLNIDIKTLPVSNVNVTGGTVNLKGKTMILGNVITSRTHLDYLTGAPLKGSKSVKASL
jgi:hypothetical protein